jgi:hypothetical protein
MDFLLIEPLLYLCPQILCHGRWKLSSIHHISLLQMFLLYMILLLPYDVALGVWIQDVRATIAYCISQWRHYIQRIVTL